MMLIDTLCYSKFEIIQLQQEESAAKSNKSRKMLFNLYIGLLRALRLSLLTDKLAICFFDKAHITKILNLIFSQSIGFCY